MKVSSQSIYRNGGTTGVLLLHGFNGSPGVFQEISEKLALAGYTIYAPLLSGHGKTPAELEKTNYKDWFASADEAYKQLAAEVSTVYILGASLGSTLGCYIASHHPVAGLITIGSPRWLHRHYLIMAASYFAQKVLRLRYFTVKTKHFPVSKEFNAGAGMFNHRVVPIKSFRDFFKCLEHVTDDMLGHITCPILIIHSTKDGLVTPKSASYLYSHVGSSQKQIVWVSQPHHSLHLGEERFTIFEHITTFLKNTQCTAEENPTPQLYQSIQKA